MGVVCFDLESGAYSAYRLLNFERHLVLEIWMDSWKYESTHVFINCIGSRLFQQVESRRALTSITQIQYSNRMMGSNDQLGQLHASMENNSWPLSILDPQPNETQYSSFRKCTKKGKERECCMCGDLGFQERLFRCHRCRHRFQHIYCSRLYSDQLQPDGVNVCDWCLDLEAKQKIQRHKRKFELQEMESRKAKEVSSIDKSKKGNTKPTFKPHVKFGGSKQRQPSSLIQDCKLSVKSCRNLPGTHPPQSSPTKSGLARRYKLLSDVIC